MQFDEKDIDKDDNSFTLPEEDSNTISWEDLLSSEDEVDLDSLIKNDDNKAAVVETGAKEPEDFDLSSMTDNEHDTDAQEDKEPAFDINNAASEYVNSLEPEIYEGPSVNTVDIAPEKETAEDISSDLENDVFLDDELKQNAEIPDDVDLSSVVDDELLGLLDADEDKGRHEEAVEVSKENAYDSDSLNNLELLTDNDADAETPASGGISSYTIKQEEQSEEEYPSFKEDKKKKQPVVLFVLIGLVGLFAIIFFLVGMFFTGKTSVADDIPLTPDYMYSNDDASGDDIQAKQEADELINKVETKKAKKEDKKDAAETKVVVAVPVGGRVNPFVPSSLFDDAGFANFGSDLSLPPDADINSSEAAEARKLLSISLSGIMYDANKPSAILKFDNKDYFVQSGDRIDTYTVKTITKEYVAIQNGSNVYKAYVGEAFKTNEGIPPQNEIKTNNGTRQYISSNDIEISTR